MQFPKGRIDSLTNHLVKKCPAIPMRDRQRAILQMHSLPDLPDNGAPSQGSSYHGMPMDLPHATRAGMSALETLAEVSRQQLDYNGNRVHHYGNERSERQPSAPEFRLQDFLVQDEKSGEDNGIVRLWPSASTDSHADQCSSRCLHVRKPAANVPLRCQSVHNWDIASTPCLVTTAEWQL